MPHFITKDGCSIYYETQSFESSKPVVVFLNGTMQNTVYWKTHSMAFRDRFRVLMYDARAQGKSDLGEKELSLEGHTEDFSALLKYLVVDKVCLVGLSHGAKVALAYAVYSPDSVDRLVLCSVSAEQTCRAKLILRSWLKILRDSDLETMAWASLPAAFGENYLKQNENILDKVVKAIVRRNRKEALIAQLEAMNSYPSMSQIVRDVQSPALILSGSDDPFITGEGARKLAMLCNGKHNHINGIGHSIPAEAPEFFSETVFQFLDRP
jgi:pimeloyl-ACP methyl ester carboxylesterase